MGFNEAEVADPRAAVRFNEAEVARPRRARRECIGVGAVPHRFNEAEVARPRRAGELWLLFEAEQGLQ